MGLLCQPSPPEHGDPQGKRVTLWDGWPQKPVVETVAIARAVPALGTSNGHPGFVQRCAMNTRHPVQQGGTAAGGSIVCCPSPQAPLSARQRCARPQGWAHRWGGSSTAWPWASQQHPLWAFSFQGRGLFLLSESAHSVLSGKSCWEAARQSAATHKALRLHPWVPQPCVGPGERTAQGPQSQGWEGGINGWG